MANISGTSNNDTLLGTAGNDVIDGSAGIDTALIASASDGAVFSRDAQQRWVVTSVQGTDTLIGVEKANLGGEIITLGRDEQRVNSTTISDQYYPKVSALVDGGWVVSWASYGQDGNSDGIYQQRYSAGGLPLGGEVLVNNTTSSAQQFQGVTALADGGWLLSWMSWGDGSSSGIYQQRFTTAGMATGGEVRVNTTIANSQSYPSVTGLADGGWLVSWQSQAQNGDDWDIYQQRFNAAGVANGGEVRVNTVTINDQDFPKVTALTDGGWVVCWQSMQQDGEGRGIYQQRYSSNGAPIGNELRVNATTSGYQELPDLTALVDGGWLVSWTSFGQDGSGYGVYQQRYSAAGTPTGGEVRVNTTTANHQLYDSVAGLSDGGWLVTWQSLAQDGSGNGIYQQRYSAAGTAIGAEIRVNSTTTAEQTRPSVTTLADGGWLVSWMSQYQDGDGWGIYQQRFDASGAAVVGGNVISGDPGANTLAFNGATAIEILGQGGADTLQASLGNDTLNGGDGLGGAPGTRAARGAAF